MPEKLENEDFYPKVPVVTLFCLYDFTKTNKNKTKPEIMGSPKSQFFK